MFQVAPGGELSSVEWSGDGNYLLVTDAFGATTTVFDDSGARVQSLYEGEAFILEAGAFSQDGRLIATAVSHGRNPLQSKVSVWDWNREDPEKRTIDAPGGGWALAFDATGDRLAMGRFDGFVDVFDPASGDR